MSKKLKFYFLMLTFLLISPALSFAETYTNSVGDPERAEQGYLANKFRDYLAEKSDGRIMIKNFYATSLNDETEALRNVQSGALPFTVAGIANLVPFDKRLGVLTLPYIFENIGQAIAGTTGDSAKLLNKWAIERGFRILAWAYSDFRYLSNSVRPIKNIKDIAGLSFRVPQSAIMIASFEAFGAEPMPISWEETFLSLQQHLVDGQDSGYIIYKTMKFNDAHQKYITESHHSYQVQPLIVSEKFFQTLPKKDQELLIEAGQYAQQEALKYQMVEREKAKADIIKMGVQISILEDEAEWKRIAHETVWPKMADFVGGTDIIITYLKTMGKTLWKSN